ncbi:hypothetical protein ACWGS9_33120 [Bradyrhizobium sp. Arg314]
MRSRASIVYADRNAEPWTRGWYEYCLDRYRTFNSRTGTLPAPSPAMTASSISASPTEVFQPRQKRWPCGQRFLLFCLTALKALRVEMDSGDALVLRFFPDIGHCGFITGGSQPPVMIGDGSRTRRSSDGSS